jgi:hypothetical protein
MQKTLELCWFCGNRAPSTDLVYGLGIGNMVYSSLLVTSSEVARGAIESHECRNSAMICRECLSLRFSQIGTIDQSYKHEQYQNLEHLLSEEADYETGLTRFEERVYSFGCWFGQYPDLGVRQRFRGMRVIELFSSGLRFRGRATFAKPEWDLFLVRFADTEEPEVSEPEDDFAAHVLETFLIPEESVSLFGQVRSVIHDLSVLKYWHEIRAAE